MNYIFTFVILVAVSFSFISEVTSPERVSVLISRTQLCSDSAYENTESGINNMDYEMTSIPAAIEYKGAVVAMAKWIDKAGENLLFVTETNESTVGDVREKELYSYHYVTDNSEYKLLWKVYDFIKDCPVDLTLEYIPNSLIITDLDDDGNGENSFIYKLSCKGDVSPDDMKLIMHEEEKKYAIRGSMNLVMNGQDIEKGSMKVDVSFNNAPDVFREFAISQWSKYKTEKIGE